MNNLTQQHANQLTALLHEFGFSIAQLKSNWVDKRLLAGQGEAIELTDPTTGEVFLSYLDAGAELVNQAVHAAKQGQRAWLALTPSMRGRLLFEASQRLVKQQAPLAQLESLISGKPIRDCQSEIAKVIEMFAYYAGWCDKLHGDVIPVPTSHLNLTQRVPYGVVAQITPWNAPAFTCGWQLAPALATGNAVVLKPSEQTPFTSLIIAKIIGEDVDFPSGLVNIISGLGSTTGNALTCHQGVQKLVFVGSPEAGQKIASNGANRLVPSVLELGGKSANIVFADANIDNAIKGAQAAIFAGAGQSCVAGSRLLLQKNIAEPFIERLVASAAKIALGLPENPATQLGPLQNQAQFKRVTSMLDKAVSEGATLRAGGKPQTPVHQDCENGYFITPSIVTDMTSQFNIAREEVFGPVLSVFTFSDEEHAIALANDSEFGLAGGIWTENGGKGLRVANQLQAGTIWINSYKAINVMSPFGGFGKSGYGRSSGLEGLHEYTTSKSIWIETAEQPATIAGYDSIVN